MDILDELKRLSQTSATIIGNVLRLVRLELQLAEKSAAIVISLLLSLLVLATGIWIGLVALLIVYLISFGIRAEISLLVAIGVHVLLALIAVLLVKKYSRHFTFPATRKQLRTHE